MSTRGLSLLYNPFIGPSDIDTPVSLEISKICASSVDPIPIIPPNHEKKIIKESEEVYPISRT